MYSKLYKNILSPLYEKGIKKRRMLDYKNFLEDSQWWPMKEKLLEFQRHELQKLLRHSYEQVPYWQEAFKKLGITSGDIKSYSDFQKLPIITKENIRNNKKRMIAENYLGKTWTKGTGGSTGVPLELDYTPDSYDWRVATSKRGYSWAGCEDGIKQLYIWGAAIGKESWLKRVKKNIHHKVLRHKYVNCFKFSEEEMNKTLKIIQRFKPKVIIGYTNPLYNFAKFINDKGIVDIKVESAISAAEKLYDFQRTEIEKAFNCKVFNTYGSREFMLIASECEEHKGLHLNMENLFVEIIKEDGTVAKLGEMGNIVVTDLHNYGMPFIRYKIGDLGVATDRICACGRGLPLIDKIEGRALDCIKTLDGRIIPGEFFPHLMKEFNEIKQFQVIQERLDTFVIKIVRSRQLEQSRLKFLQDEIRKVTGSQITFDIQFLDQIPLTKTGKLRVTISNIK